MPVGRRRGAARTLGTRRRRRSPGSVRGAFRHDDVRLRRGWTRPPASAAPAAAGPLSRGPERRRPAAVPSPPAPPRLGVKRQAPAAAPTPSFPQTAGHGACPPSFPPRSSTRCSAFSPQGIRGIDRGHGENGPGRSRQETAFVRRWCLGEPRRRFRKSGSGDGCEWGPVRCRQGSSRHGPGRSPVGMPRSSAAPPSRPSCQASRNSAAPRSAGRAAETRSIWQHCPPSGAGLGRALRPFRRSRSSGSGDRPDARHCGRGEGIPAEGAARPRHAPDGRQDQGRPLLDARLVGRRAGAGPGPLRRHGQPRDRGPVARRELGRLRRAERRGGRRRPREPGAHQVRHGGAGPPAAGTRLSPARRARRAGSLRPRHPRPAVRRPGDRGDAGTAWQWSAGTIRHGRRHRPLAAGDAARARRTAGTAARAVPRRQLFLRLRGGRGRTGRS